MQVRCQGVRGALSRSQSEPVEPQRQAITDGRREAELRPIIAKALRELLIKARSEMSAKTKRPAKKRAASPD
jgi:hypothetical protein